jgi:5'-nucleotidase
VAALDPLGELLIVAPRVQQTCMGRASSQQGEIDGRLFARKISNGQHSWPAFAANATPALAIQHGVQELARRRVDLVVSGINYGENVGAGVTISGTIGAALEAAIFGIPAIAISLELEGNEYQEYDHSVDFSAAASFAHLFAGRLLGRRLPADIDVLKIEVPCSATAETEWMVTRQDKMTYYQTIVHPRQELFDGPGYFSTMPRKGKFSGEGTDTYALAQGLVSVTPLSLDLTSRVSKNVLSQWLGQDVAGAGGEG